MKFNLSYFAVSLFILASIGFFLLSKFEAKSFEFLLGLIGMLFALHLMNNIEIEELEEKLKNVNK